MWNQWNIFSFINKFGASLALAVATATLCGAFALLGIDPYWDGAALRAAHDAGMVHREALYHLWHAPFYLQGLHWWQLAGNDSLYWSRWFAVAWLTAGVVCWELALRPLLGGRARGWWWGVAGIATVIVTWQSGMLIRLTPEYPIFALAGAAALCMVRAVRCRTGGGEATREWIWCGVCCGIGLWMLPVGGAVLAAGGLIGLLGLQWYAAAGWGAAGRAFCVWAAGGMVAFAGIAVGCGLDAARQFKAVGWTMLGWKTASPAGWLTVGVVACFLLFLAVRPKARQSDRMAAVAALPMLALLPPLLPRMDGLMLLVPLIPATGLVFWIFQRYWEKIGMAVAAVAIMAVICGGYSLWQTPNRWVPHRVATAPEAIRGIWIPAASADFYDRIQAAVARTPGRFIGRPIVSAMGNRWWELFFPGWEFAVVSSLEQMQQMQPLLLCPHGDSKGATLWEVYELDQSVALLRSELLWGKP